MPNAKLILKTLSVSLLTFSAKAQQSNLSFTKTIL